MKRARKTFSNSGIKYLLCAIFIGLCIIVLAELKSISLIDNDDRAGTSPSIIKMASDSLKCILGGNKVEWGVAEELCLKNEKSTVSDCIHKEKKPTHPSIPKLIWTFWNDKNLDKFILDCISGWKLHNPDYTVTIITLDTISQYINTPRPSNFGDMWPMYMADWIRLAVIMEHGGIWLDASSIVTGSFDYLMERQEENGSEGFAYHLGDFTKDPANPVIESWFVASIPNGRFISAWFNEFNKCLGNFRMNDLYLDHLKRQYGEDGYAAILQNLQLESYLKIHVTCMKVITMDGAPHPYSEAAEEGPLKLLWMTGFNDWGQVERLVAQKWEEPIPPFFKLRGGARWAMIRTLDPTAEEYKETHEESIYARFVRGRLEMMKATELRVEGMSEDMMAILHKREVRKAREVKEEVELVKKRDDALGEFFKERMKGREFTR